MLRGVVAVVCLAAMVLVWRIVVPIRAVWRGDASRVPTLSKFQPHARTYLTYCLSVGTACAGTGLLLLAMLLDSLSIWRMPEPIGLLGIGAFWAGLALLPAHVIVGALNWPNFLVAPAYRSQPGWIGSAIKRTRRRRTDGK
jgi:hypothetical protein